MVKKDFSVLHPGDFYLTKHSNLCETHVVFHMVTDNSEQDNNITSRYENLWIKIDMTSHERKWKKLQVTSHLYSLFMFSCDLLFLTVGEPF